ncbi:MAG: hypothetical protein QG622_1993 [Actinomycetota bacterium]|nr:hypothetical protein [Actinomycetota bacterium]
MRILHIVTLVDDSVSYGGAVTMAVNQCIELRRRGHDARIAGGWRGEGRPPERLEGVPAHLFRVRPVAPGMGFSGLFALALLRWAEENTASFDVVHLHLARDLVPLSVGGVLRRVGAPYVVQTHGALAPSNGVLARVLDHRFTRDTLLAARHIFTLTLDERDAVARVSGTAEGISLLRSGIVLPERVPATRHDGPADVLFLSRLHPDRRVMAFAAAAERLVADGVDATFSVVGPDGGDLRTLRRFIAEHRNLAGRLRYEGALPHGRAVERLRHADLFVFPSVERQACPMSLLEAMAAGVPSICTTECSLAGTVAREQAAIVANPTDDALFGAMRRLLVDRAARARLSARAAATAASVFSMTAVAEALEERYALCRHPTASPGADLTRPDPGTRRDTGLGTDPPPGPEADPETATDQHEQSTLCRTRPPSGITRRFEKVTAGGEPLPGSMRGAGRHRRDRGTRAEDGGHDREPTLVDLELRPHRQIVVPAVPEVIDLHQQTQRSC